MARKRMLSPEMFTSPTVCALPVPARWTWAGLLTYLDDYGYGEDAAALVKATVWPRDDHVTAETVEEHLGLIAKSGAICRFTCCGVRQMHAPKWTDWQTVSHPSKPRRCICPVVSHSLGAHELHRKVSGGVHETLRLIELKSVQENLSDSHELSDCLRPEFCHFHRVPQQRSETLATESESA